MHQRYMYAIILIQHFGKSDISFTMTCNHSLPEIEKYLLSMNEAQNRPDLICRVFKTNVEKLKTYISKNIFVKLFYLFILLRFKNEDFHMLILF